MYHLFVFSSLRYSLKSIYIIFTFIEQDENMSQEEQAGRVTDDKSLRYFLVNNVDYQRLD